MQIGLFFGSFNPIHIGHLIIANYILEYGDADQVWLVVSPQNPLKNRNELLDDQSRLEMVRIAVEDQPNLKASDIEFNMPKPSYTINTLRRINELHPENEPVLIIGGDNLATFHLWKEYESILENYKINVYERPGCQLGPLAHHPNIFLHKAPLLDISSTYIRISIKQGKSIRYLVPDRVGEYIARHSIFK